MKDIKDYFGTKTAIKCENEQQWEKLKELCGCNLQLNKKFDKKYPLFSLGYIGNPLDNGVYTILPYSDFVSDVPELVGVEMEVSDDGEYWEQDIIFGTYNGIFIGAKYAMPFCRPIQPKKVLTVTLSELTEMLNVDEIQLK